MSASTQQPGGATRGGCLCGAVRYEVRGPYRWMAHCHCSMCRKHHGALFSTSLGVAARRFRWLAGEAAIVPYRATAAFARPYCRVCGSKVPGASQLPAVVNVPAGTLDGDVAMRPRTHIFVASKSPAALIDDGLPQFAEYPPGTGFAPCASPARDRLDDADGITGSCLCGAVAYRVEGDLELTVHCHCERCRRSSGAAYATVSHAPRERFRWLRGSGLVAGYRPAGGQRCATCFCSLCGSLLPAIDGTRVRLPAGSIDRPLAAPAPAAHVHVAAKAPWHEITDDLPRFAGAPPPGFGRPRARPEDDWNGSCTACP